MANVTIFTCEACNRASSMPGDGMPPALPVDTDNAGPGTRYQRAVTCPRCGATIVYDYVFDGRNLWTVGEPEIQRPTKGKP